MATEARSAAFVRALPVVLRLEGVGLPGNPTGLADIPGDTGGVTNYGITQATYQEWKGNEYADVREITPHEVEAIYWERYWKAAHCDELPFVLALAHFDCAVNQGVAAAIKMLQRVLNVDADGIFGPKTRAALKATFVSRVTTDSYLFARLAEYAATARRNRVKNPAALGFLASLWIPRLLKLRAELA